MSALEIGGAPAMPRVIVGVGFRRDAPAASIAQAMNAALGPLCADGVAAAADKAVAPALAQAAAGLPVTPVSPAALTAADAGCLTRSARVRALRGVGSLAEAAALAAAGPGARLVGPRVSSTDGTATAAVAVLRAAGSVVADPIGSGR
jgi:cobalt-precorrin 5A hydrolase